MQPQRFTAVLVADPRGRVYVPLPFDPDEAWGAKPTHHVTGTVSGHGVRGPLQRLDPGYGLVLGAAWRAGCGLDAGLSVEVLLRPEGPQRAELAPDIAAALDADPAAAAFFDSLATFYRKGYLRWIDATTRRPDLRAARIAEMITLLAAGRKQRDR